MRKKDHSKVRNRSRLVHCGPFAVTFDRSCSPLLSSFLCCILVFVVSLSHLLIYSPMLGDGRIEVHRGGSIEFISLASNDEPFYFNHSQLPKLNSNPNLAGMTIDHIQRQLMKVNIGRSLMQAVQAENDTSNVEMSDYATTPSTIPLESTLISSTGVDQSNVYDINDATLRSTTAIGNSDKDESNLSQSSSSTGASDPTASPFSSTSLSSSTGSSSVLPTSSMSSSSSSIDVSSTGSVTGSHLSSTSTGTSTTNQSSQTNSTSPSSSSSSSTTGFHSSSTGSHQPPVIPVVPNSFIPHPTAILLSYGGGLLFTHGTFVFLAPFQSSLTDGDANSVATANRNVANRFAISPHAHVIFDQLTNLPTITNYNSSGT